MGRQTNLGLELSCQDRRCDKAWNHRTIVVIASRRLAAAVVSCSKLILEVSDRIYSLYLARNCVVSEIYILYAPKLCQCRGLLVNYRGTVLFVYFSQFSADI